MSNVLAYLDCGCAILKDGGRSWCPTCISSDNSASQPLKPVIAGSPRPAIDALQKVLDAAKAYDAALSEMEREHKRPDLYFTQHSTLLPLRLAVRKLQEAG